MGLVTKGDDFTILTDIQGMEDALGDMDFKVAGTMKGVTAIQMDIKIKGLSREILAQALKQAHEGRMHIMGKMLQVINEPRKELSPYAPRIISMHIKPDKIRDVIGPGGKMIKQITEETGAKIDIDDSGLVYIAAVDGESGQKAKEWIEKLTEDVEVGKTYVGKVTRLMNFGAFVEVLPGKEGWSTFPSWPRNASKKSKMSSMSAMKSWSNASKSTARAVSTCPAKPSWVAATKARPIAAGVPAAVITATTARNGKAYGRQRI